LAPKASLNEVPATSLVKTKAVLTIFLSTLLVTMLAMVCPFDPPEKQALLEASEGSERAEMLVALLRMGATANMPNPGSVS